MNVPFNKPVRLADHLDVLGEALSLPQLAGNGAFTKKCEDLLEQKLSVPARLVTSATHALEMMALVSGVGPGDEVILPSFTFVSTANPFALRGARLKFADNDAFGNILPSEVERLMTKKTKVVVAVDYAGASPDYDALEELCQRHGATLFEDAAQGVGATYKGKPLGTLGSLGCYSFHDTKNITSGEGGALLMRDDRFVDEAEIIREKGTNRRKFLMGQIDKYSWVGIGSSYVLSELNAAYLYPQLQRLDEINGKRGELCRRYDRELGSELARLDTQVLRTPAFNTPNYHIFALIFPRNELRNAFIAHMKAAHISCPFHYVPLHSSPFGHTFYEGGTPESLPGCDRIAGCLVRLPLYYNMTAAEQDYVIENAVRFFRK